MKITIVSVGKSTSTEIEPLINDYERRLSAYNVQVTWTIVKSANPSLPQQRRLDIEAATIIKAISAGSYPILLDETGEQLNTKVLSAHLEELSAHSEQICIIIGGSYGVNQSIKQLASKTWALSKLTLPHMLVRLLIAEQLYRAFSIINNGKYHHE